MVKGAIYSAIKYKKITLFTTVLLMLFGLYNYYYIPRQEYPHIDPPVAIITAVYPGASPEDVEKLVTKKIEDKLVEITGYDYTYSTSRNSLSVVVLRLEDNIDVNKAWADLRQKMDDLQSELPQGCGDIEVNTDVVETAGVIISMSGDGYSYEELEAYAGELKNELSRIDGISKFEITGTQEKEVKIEVDLDKLNYYGLSMGDLENIIKSQNIEIPSGQIDDGNVKINVSVPGTYSSLDQIKNTIILVSGSNGSVARLKDIAKVSMAPEDSNYRIKQDGRNAVLLTGYFKKNRNVVLVGKDVKKTVDSFRERLPQGIVFEKVLFQPDDVSDSINDFIINLLEGVVFVVIVTLIGMGLQNALIVSTAIPFSIINTFTAMKVIGIEIHQVSVAALIIALGMLVDNAIVVSDAIQVRLDKGQDKLDACIEGTMEVAVPVLTSTLTTVGAFIPLLILPSIAGEYVKSIPQIIIISLSFSYIAALFVTPVMAYIFFKPSGSGRKVYRFRRYFSNLLDMGMNNKGKVILLSAAAFILSMLAAATLGLQFFPKADKNILYVDVRTEQDSNIDKTEQIINSMTDILKKQPEIISLTAAIGDGLPKFYNTMPPYTKSPDFGQFLVKVDLRKGGRFKTNTQLANHLQELLDGSIVGGTVTVKELEQADPTGSPVTVRITGDDLERLRETAGEIRNTLSGINGTININDDFSDRVYQFSMETDDDKAGLYGISKYDIQREINMVLQGKEVSTFRKGGKEYGIILKGNIKSKEELENFRIKSSVSGHKVALKEISDVKLVGVLPCIKKYDREICITVTADVRSGFNPVRIERQLEKKLEKANLDDVKILYEGEKSKIIEYFGELGVSSIFAVLVIFGILLLQFNSFTQPLIIMLTIPLSIIGSVLGLLIFRQPLSFTALLGMVSLMGVVVNNAIVLVDYINKERREGKNVEEACCGAVEMRFRPIMLTTITTIIGLIPLLMAGSQLFTPMAISLMFGLLLSTILTLIVIPVVYCVSETKLKKSITDYWQRSRMLDG